MYTPLDKGNPQYPFFKRINGRIISFLSARGAVAIGLAVLLALLLTSTVGKITTSSEVELTEHERVSAEERYKAYRAALVDAEIAEDLAPFYESETVLKDGLTQEEVDEAVSLRNERSANATYLVGYEDFELDGLRAEAAENGITASTSDAEISSMVPATKTVEEPVFDMFFVISFFWVLPIGFVALMFLELDGSSSFYTYLRDYVRYHRRQHRYYYSSSLDR